MYFFVSNGDGFLGNPLKTEGGLSKKQENFSVCHKVTLWFQHLKGVISFNSKLFFEGWAKKSRHLHGGLNSIWAIRFLRKRSGGFDRDLLHEIHDDPSVAPVQLCQVREGQHVFYIRHIIH